MCVCMCMIQWQRSVRDSKETWRSQVMLCLFDICCMIQSQRGVRDFMVIWRSHLILFCLIYIHLYSSSTIDKYWMFECKLS